MSKSVVICECPSCGGTGLYRGFAERPGTAVVCLECGGQGWRKLQYTEFTGRKRKNNVKEIYESRGSFIVTGVGPRDDNAMTYSEFNTKFPVNVPKEK